MPTDEDRIRQLVERAGNTLSILNRRAGASLIARDANMLAPVGQ